jgi:hypothetical protein
MPQKNWKSAAPAQDSQVHAEGVYGGSPYAQGGQGRPASGSGFPPYAQGVPAGGFGVPPYAQGRPAGGSGGDAMRRAQTAFATAGKTVGGGIRGQFGKWVEFSAISMLVVLALLSYQPWFSLGQKLLQQITHVPFGGLLVSIPMLSLVVKWVVYCVYQMVSVALWLGANMAQAGGLVVKLFPRIPREWQNFILAVHGNRWWWVGAYAIETLISYDRYPAIGKNLFDLFAVVQQMDPMYLVSQVSWVKAILLMLTVGSFETICLGFVALLESSKRGN